MTAVGRTTVRQRRRRPAGTYVVYWIVSVIVVAGIGVWATLLFGRVRGQEFSPETLSRRTFTYYQVPLLSVQVTPIDRTIVASATEQFLLGNKYVTPITPEKWDLVDGHQGSIRVDTRTASILCAYFDTKNGQSNFYWIVWSQDHPQLAAILWPDVIAAARLRCYEMIPDIMTFANNSDQQDPQAFQAALEKLVADESVRLGRWFAKIDERKARDLYELALSKDADHAGALEGIEQLGKK